jgi:hypothetical protein
LTNSKYALAPATVSVPKNFDGPSSAEHEPINISLSVTPGAACGRAAGPVAAINKNSMAHNVSLLLNIDSPRQASRLKQTAVPANVRIVGPVDE